MSDTKYSLSFSVSFSTSKANKHNISRTHEFRFYLTLVEFDYDTYDKVKVP